MTTLYVSKKGVKIVHMVRFHPFGWIEERSPDNCWVFFCCRSDFHRKVEHRQCTEHRNHHRRPDHQGSETGLWHIFCPTDRVWNRVLSVSLYSFWVWTGDSFFWVGVSSSWLKKKIVTIPMLARPCEAWQIHAVIMRRHAIGWSPRVIDRSGLVMKPFVQFITAACPITFFDFQLDRPTRAWPVNQTSR